MADASVVNVMFTKVVTYNKRRECSAIAGPGPGYDAPTLVLKQRIAQDLASWSVSTRYYHNRQQHEQIFAASRTLRAAKAYARLALQHVFACEPGGRVILDLDAINAALGKDGPSAASHHQELAR